MAKKSNELHRIALLAAGILFSLFLLTEFGIGFTPQVLRTASGLAFLVAALASDFSKHELQTIFFTLLDAVLIFIK